MPVAPKAVIDGTAPIWARQFADEVNSALARLVSTRVALPSFSKTSLPPATTPGIAIYVTDEAGGAVMAVADGTNWRRQTDRAVVS